MLWAVGILPPTHPVLPSRPAPPRPPPASSQHAVEQLQVRQGTCRTYMRLVLELAAHQGWGGGAGGGGGQGACFSHQGWGEG